AAAMALEQTARGRRSGGRARADRARPAGSAANDKEVMLELARSIVRRFRDARPMRRVRLERFGAIVQLAWPRALVFVDRAMARRAARIDADAAAVAWREPETALGDHVLSAPLEAHLQLTNRCSAGCTGCYTGASSQGAPNEWGL